MPRPDYQLGHYLAAILALLLGLIGVLMIGRLFTAWRRYNARLRERHEASERTAVTDAWATAAERLADRPTDPGDPGDPEGDDDRDDSPPSPEPPKPQRPEPHG